MIPIETIATFIQLAAGPALATTILHLQGIKRIKEITVERESPEKKALGKSSTNAIQRGADHYVQVATGAKAQIAVEAADGTQTTIQVDDDVHQPNRFTAEAEITVNHAPPVPARAFKVVPIPIVGSDQSVRAIHLPGLPGFSGDPAQTFRDFHPKGERNMRQ